jgi:hypothetical protein
MDVLASYKVKIREGSNKGIIHCVNMITREEVLRIFNRLGFFRKSYVYMGHIGGTGKFEEDDCMRFDGRDFDSMFFDCKNNEHADRCLKYFGLSMVS